MRLRVSEMRVCRESEFEDTKGKDVNLVQHKRLSRIVIGTDRFVENAKLKLDYMKMRQQRRHTVKSLMKSRKKQKHKL